MKYSKIITLLFLLNLYLMICYAGITSVQTFTNPNPNASTTTTTNKNNINNSNNSNNKNNNSPSTRAFQSQPQQPHQQIPKTTNKVLKTLNCPKNKVEFCFSEVNQCNNDGDCKLYGENQKCCLRLGCGKRCLRGITV